MNARAIAAGFVCGVTGGPRRPREAPNGGAETNVTHAEEPPPDPPRGLPQSEEPAQEGGRDVANIVALIFVIALAVGAIWLFNAIQRDNEILNCVASGRRNCEEPIRPAAPAP
jgi:hypothetical protein